MTGGPQMPEVPEMPELPDVTALLAEIRAATANVRETARGVAAEREALARETEDVEERRAAAARRGELGEDWRRLQERIDVGQASLAGVLAGTDTSPEARRIADATMDRLVAVTHEARTWVEESPDDPYGDLAAAAGRVDAALRRIAELAPDGDLGPGRQEGDRS